LPCRGSARQDRGRGAFRRPLKRLAHRTAACAPPLLCGGNTRSAAGRRPPFARNKGSAGPVPAARTLPRAPVPLPAAWLARGTRGHARLRRYELAGREERAFAVPKPPIGQAGRLLAALGGVPPAPARKVGGASRPALPPSRPPPPERGSSRRLPGTDVRRPAQTEKSGAAGERGRRRGSAFTARGRVHFSALASAASWRTRPPDADRALPPGAASSGCRSWAPVIPARNRVRVPAARVAVGRGPSPGPLRGPEWPRNGLKPWPSGGRSRRAPFPVRRSAPGEGAAGRATELRGLGDRDPSLPGQPQGPGRQDRPPRKQRPKATEAAAVSGRPHGAGLAGRSLHRDAASMPRGGRNGSPAPAGGPRRRDPEAPPALAPGPRKGGGSVRSAPHPPPPGTGRMDSSAARPLSVQRTGGGPGRVNEGGASLFQRRGRLPPS
jgi:hypothetical protein